VEVELSHEFNAGSIFFFPLEAVKDCPLLSTGRAIRRELSPFFRVHPWCGVLQFVRAEGPSTVFLDW